MTTTMQNPGIRPLGRYLLVNVTPREQKTAAGIVLPVAVQGANTRMEAVVVDRGPECESSIEPGTSVYLATYKSGEIVRGGITYRLALETDVIATLEDVSVSMPEPVVVGIHPGI